MPQTTEFLLDMKQESALTSWQPNPDSLLTCVDYPSSRCDLGKNAETEGNASRTVFEITMLIKVTLKLEIKRGEGEGYELYSLSELRGSRGLREDR